MILMDSTQVTNYIFVIGFCAMFIVSFAVLQASRLEECFKKGRVWQIRVAYIILSIIISYLVTMCLIKIGESFIIV